MTVNFNTLRLRGIPWGKIGQWGLRIAEALGRELLGSVKQNIGGSVWESNPPKTLLVPPNGFEVREAHRDLYTPSRCHSKYKLSSRRAQPSPD